MAEKKTTSKTTTSKTVKRGRPPKGEEKTLICTTAHLSQMFGVTERQIYKLMENGVVIKLAPNKLDCVQSVANYIAQKKEEEAVKNQKPEQIRNMTEAVKLKHEQMKSRKTELQVLQLEGKLHYEEDVKALWNSSVVAVKSRLTSIGVKIAPQLKGEMDISVIQDLIDREIYDALKEISDYDASAYEKDLTNIDEEGDDDE